MCVDVWKNAKKDTSALEIRNSASAVIEYVKTITIKKFANAKLKIYISRILLKHNTYFSMIFSFWRDYKWSMFAVFGTWMRDFDPLKATKSWGFFNSRSLTRCKLKPNKNTMVEDVAFFLLLFSYYLFGLHSHANWSILNIFLQNSTKIEFKNCHQLLMIFLRNIFLLSFSSLHIFIDKLCCDHFQPIAFS